MKTTLLLFLAVLLYSCEPISDHTTSAEYSGSITYSLPSINQTTVARRTFSEYSVRWWDAPPVIAPVHIENNSYQFSQVIIPKHPSCADTLTLTHSGTGVFSSDSLIESGSVIYYRKVGVIEIIEHGTFNAKFKRQ